MLTVFGQPQREEWLPGSGDHFRPVDQIPQRPAPQGNPTQWAVPAPPPVTCMDVNQLHTTRVLRWVLPTHGSFGYTDAHCTTLKKGQRVNKMGWNLHGDCVCADRGSSLKAKCGGQAAEPGVPAHQEILIHYYEGNTNCQGTPVTFAADGRCNSAYGIYSKLSFSSSEYNLACSGHQNPQYVVDLLADTSCAQENDDARSDVCIKSNCCKQWKSFVTKCYVNPHCTSAVNTLTSGNKRITTEVQLSLLCRYAGVAASNCAALLSCAHHHDCMDDAKNKCTHPYASQCLTRCNRCVNCAPKKFGGHGASLASDGRACSTCNSCNKCIQYIDCVRKGPPPANAGSQCSDSALTRTCGSWSDPMSTLTRCGDLMTFAHNWKTCLTSSQCWDVFFGKNRHFSSSEACKFACIKFKALKSCNVDCDKFCGHQRAELPSLCSTVMTDISRCTSNQGDHDACNDILQFTLASFFDQCNNDPRCIDHFTTYASNKIPCLRGCSGDPNCVRLIDAFIGCEVKYVLYTMAHNTARSPAAAPAQAPGQRRLLSSSKSVPGPAQSPSQSDIEEFLTNTMVKCMTKKLGVSMFTEGMPELSKYGSRCALSGMFGSGDSAHNAFMMQVFHTSNAQAAYSQFKQEFCMTLPTGKPPPAPAMPGGQATCNAATDLNGTLCGRLVQYMNCNTYIMRHTCSKACCNHRLNQRRHS